MNDILHALKEKDEMIRTLQAETEREDKEHRFKTRLHSLNPDLYRLETIEKLEQDYQKYLTSCVKSDRKPKSLEEWRLTA